jgi:hypothetical protein
MSTAAWPSTEPPASIARPPNGAVDGFALPDDGPPIGNDGQATAAVGKIFRHQLVTSTIDRDVPSEAPSGISLAGPGRFFGGSAIREPQSLRNGEKSVVVRNTRLIPA